MNISKRVLLLFSLLFLPTSVVFAENNQTFVLGLGFFGIHNFSTTDDLRKTSLFFSDGIQWAGAADLYVEWYGLEELGIGIRSNTLGVAESVTSGGVTNEREFTISNNFITLNWVPLGASSYYRLGLLAGIGRSRYEHRYNSNVASSSGPATLLGGYLDWGAEDFGARLTYNVLSTDLDDLNGNHVDASGNYWTVDFRWAIE